jgi:hypothetical protein
MAEHSVQWLLLWLDSKDICTCVVNLSTMSYKPSVSLTYPRTWWRVQITTNVVAGPCNQKFCWRNIDVVGHSTVCWCEEGTSWIQFPNLGRALNCNMFCPFFACSTTDTLNGGKRLTSIFQELVVCFRHQNVCYTTFQVCRAHPWRLQDDGTFHDMLTHHPKPVNSYFNDEHCILITMPFGTCVVFLSMNSCQDLYVNIESSARMMHIFLWVPSSALLYCQHC